MGLFKSREEKERIKEGMELEQRISALDKYPGNLAEYNILKGVEHIPIDLNQPEKWVQVLGTDRNPDYNVFPLLFQEGCVGFIHYVPIQNTYMHSSGGYGVPVKRKET